MGSKLTAAETTRLSTATGIAVGALRFIVAGLLIASGLLHLQNVPAHYVAIANYRLLPNVFSQILAFVLPSLHVAVGVSLVLNEFRLPCLLVSTGLATLYLGAQVSVLVRGMRIDCGCFGTLAESTIGLSTIARTAFLLSVCIWLTLLEAGFLHSRHATLQTRSSSRNAMSLIELLVVIGVIGIILGLILPAVQAARESGRRMSCMSNQRQLVVGAQLHESTYSKFPSTGWGYNWVGMQDQGAGKKQPGSWIYAILPNIEQAALWSASPSVQRPHASIEFQRYVLHRVPTLICPSKPIDDILPANENVAYRYAATIATVSRTDYAINAGDTALRNQPGPNSIGEIGYGWLNLGNPNGVAFARSEIRFSDITDGTTHVLLCGEKWSESPGIFDRGYDQPWSTGDSQESRRFTEFIFLRDGSTEGSFDRFGSSHAGGGVFGFVDGSVHFLPFSIHPTIYRTLGNRFDGNSGVSGIP
jgi:prepilin-type N-terminal cleavage/methylation domain-containing protein